MSQPTETLDPTAAPARVPINQASELTLEVSEQIDEMFGYHPWDEKQTARGAIVRDALAAAVKLIVSRVPPCPDRAAAIRKLREARMDCNSAITFQGRY